MILKRANLIHNSLFVEFLFFKSKTASAPILKTFKRFPVDPTPEYITEIRIGYIELDFNKKDVLIEILNIQFELQDLCKNGIIGHSFEWSVDKEIKNLCKVAEITL